MRVFLTGGSGFVGRHLIQRLRSEGHEVLAAARSPSAAELVSRLGAEVWRGALDDAPALAMALNGIDAVVHSAAHLKMWGPLAEFEASNIGLARNLLEATRAARVRHFIHISAASVVMDEPTALVDIDETAPMTTSAVLPYSSTKARAEKLVISAATDEMRTIALRPPFIWGPGDAVDRDLGVAIAKGRFGWFNGGRYPYATCHVLNLAEAVVCALRSPTTGRAHFITDGEPVVLRAFMERRIAAARLPMPRMSVPTSAAWVVAGMLEALWRALRWQSEPPLTREVVRLMGFPFSVDTRRAREDLGYRPVVSVDEGLRQLGVHGEPGVPTPGSQPMPARPGLRSPA